MKDFGKDFGNTHTLFSSSGTVARIFRARSLRYTRCTCAFFTKSAGIDQTCGVLSMSCTPHLQQFAATLRRDEAQAEPGLFFLRDR